MPDTEAERLARAYYVEETPSHLADISWEDLPEYSRAWRVDAMRRVLDSLGAVTEQRLVVRGGEHRALRPHEVGKPLGQHLKDAGAKVEYRTVFDWRNVDEES